MQELYTLDNSRQSVLTELIKLIADKYKPEYIWCFGIIQERKRMVNAFSEPIDRLVSRYYLLMLTKETVRIENTVQDFINSHFEKAEVTIIVHNVETIQKSVKQGNRFYNAVFRDGMQLYSASGILIPMELSNLNPITTLSQAEKVFDHRYWMAVSFMEAGELCYENAQYGNCVFMFHQAVEQACISIIRVYMAYRSDIHNLARLLNFCQCCIHEPRELFPKDNDEDKRLFNILVKSYSDARYDDGFTVSDHDAEQLSERVSNFLKLVKELCDRKIIEYRQAVAARKGIEQTEMATL